MTRKSTKTETKTTKAIKATETKTENKFNVSLKKINDTIEKKETNEKKLEALKTELAKSLDDLKEAVNDRKSGIVDENNCEVERAFAAFLEQCETDGDIEGTHIDEENLKKYNKANILALLLFGDGNIESFETDMSKNFSFAETFILCENFCIEEKKTKSKELFMQFIEIVDFFDIRPTTPTIIQISFCVNNVWKA